MNIEQQRTRQKEWTKWGPYVSDRQWGTVREDYSPHGDAWLYTTHDMARSQAWRWGEEGIAGISDSSQLLCFAVAMWNKKDPLIKERLFGLTSQEGNHGEDVKELYYYLDSSPSHSYMKMLYKYPQAAFPYEWLLQENKRRNREQPEFELMDTGLFDQDQYFDVFVEYAKADTDDILVRITVCNRGGQEASLNLLPTLWFRNTWSWGYDGYTPCIMSSNNGNICIEHRQLGELTLHVEQLTQHLYCDNETNCGRLYGYQKPGFFKDGVNQYLLHGEENAVNINQRGTKATLNYDLTIGAGQQATIRLRLESKNNPAPFQDFDQVFAARQQDTDAFYGDLQKNIPSEEERMIQRQAFAGMLWSKQFYYYDVDQWLKGDPSQPPPPAARLKGRNAAWRHLNNEDIISMPDKWEYPWYAAWDLAFHCISFSLIDPAFAKRQLVLLTREWYMHPNGQLPAYEWTFSDTNPPVHAWAAWRLYEIDKQNNNQQGDTPFLETIFHKLLLNFTWWVNRKDAEGNNIFEGGFLGMDNIGLFDRSSTQLPTGGRLEQADGTSWMAMYSLNLMRIALELAKTNPVYQDMATKFFEHFLYIAGAMASMGVNSDGLWDDEDSFFYDVLRFPDDGTIKLKIRSMVGLVPLFAVEVLDDALMQSQPEFAGRLKWFLDNRPELASLVSRWHEKGMEEKHLLSLLRGHRMKMILRRMLDETEFLSDYGIRALSKYHLEHPYGFDINGQAFSVSYSPAESTIPLFGGNSNWRGPVWMPVNFLIIESLERFHHYYGDDFKVEHPTGSGKFLTLNDIGMELTGRLIRLFTRDASGRRPVMGDYDKLQQDPHFSNYILFYEYFHGDNGRGVGASHQTGWTGLIAKLLQPRIKGDSPVRTDEENIEGMI